MAEQKKVAFSTISSENGDVKRKKTVRTIRLALALSESNEKTCPEFNYRELLSHRLLLKRHEKKKVDGQILNGPIRDADDPLAAEEDEALKALARQLEKKYGGGGKRRKRDRDFKTLGEGYDETDPFIDNSDAVDDVVPTNKETKHRGFYINSGELDFDEVPVSEGEESPDDECSIESSITQITKRKKNVISSDEEEAPEIAEGKKVSKLHPRENGVLVKNKKRKLDEGEMLRRRKKLIDKFNAKKQVKKDDSEDLCMGDQDEPDEDFECRSPTEDKEPSSAEKSIAASIEAVVNMAREAITTPSPTPDHEPPSPPQPTPPPPPPPAPQEEPKAEVEAPNVANDESSSSSSLSSSSSSFSESSSSVSDSEKDEEKETEKEGTPGNQLSTEEQGRMLNDTAESHVERGSISDAEQETVPLPSNLSPDLIEVIDCFKEAGKTCRGSSQKFFTDSVNKLLLSIEIKVNKMGGRRKTQIYNHLSQHLPCGTQTLIKRGKSLLNENLEHRLKVPLEKLRQIVNELMPPLIDKHAIECQKAAEKNPQQYWELCYHFWGEGDHQKEEEDDQAAASGSSKKAKLPKKKFLFSESTREILCDIVKVRCQAYTLIKKRAENAETHIRNFLEAQVKPIWPKGWMTTKILYKESDSVHSSITRLPVQKKYHPTIMASGVVENRNPVCMNENLVPPIEIPSDITVTKASKEASSKTSLPEKSTANLVPETPIPTAPSTPLPEEVALLIEKTPPSKLQSERGKNVSPKQPSQAPLPPPTESNATQGITSPMYDSSPASFLGFESPIKNVEISTNNVNNDLKQSLAFEMNKKPRSKSPQYDTSMPVREGKPPKPSLTATVLPRVSLSTVSPTSKVEAPRKSPSEDDRKTINCITIKTVERINEGAHHTPEKKANKDQVASGPPSSEKKEPPSRPSKPVDTSGAIDLSTDTRKTEVESEQKVSMDLSNKSRTNDVSPLSDSGQPVPESSQRNEKLEQEIDDVMNELLQISKQKQEKQSEPHFEAAPSKPLKTAEPFSNKPTDSSVSKPPSESINAKPHPKVSSRQHSSTEGERMSMVPPAAHMQQRSISHGGSTYSNESSHRSHTQPAAHQAITDIHIESVSISKASAGQNNSNYQQNQPRDVSDGLSTRISTSIFPVSRPSAISSHRSHSSQATIHVSSLGAQQLSPHKTPPISPIGLSHSSPQVPAHSSHISIHRVSPKSAQQSPSYTPTNLSTHGAMHSTSPLHNPHSTSNISIFSTSQGPVSSQGSHLSSLHSPHISTHSHGSSHSTSGASHSSHSNSGTSHSTSGAPHSSHSTSGASHSSHNTSGTSHNTSGSSHGTSGASHSSHSTSGTSHSSHSTSHVSMHGTSSHSSAESSVIRAISSSYDTPINTKSSRISSQNSHNSSHSSSRSSSYHSSYINSSHSALSNYSQGSKASSSSQSTHHLPPQESLHGYNSHSSRDSHGTARGSYPSTDPSPHGSSRGSHASLESSHSSRGSHLSLDKSHGSRGSSHLNLDASHGASRGSHSGIDPSIGGSRGSHHSMESLHRSQGSSKQPSSTSIKTLSVSITSPSSSSSSHGPPYSSSSSSYNTSSGGISLKTVRSSMASPPHSSKSAHHEYSHHRHHHQSGSQKLHSQMTAQQHQKLLQGGSSWAAEAASLRGNSSGYESAMSVKSSPSKQQRSPDGSYTGGNADPLANLRMMQGLSVSNLSKKQQQHSSSTMPHGLTSPNSNHGPSSSSLMGSSSSSHRSSGSASLPPGASSSKMKQRAERVSPHSLYDNFTKEQIELLKSRQQQHPELWSQMNVNNYLSGLPPNDVYKYISQSGGAYPHPPPPPSGSSGGSKKY